MSRTYSATGINLKSMPLSEADRLLTVLTREYGLIRVVAPGARKPKAKLGGRSALFVVNQLFLGRGRSLDKILQAETIESYPALSRDLGKLTVSQYWAELALGLVPNADPHPQLFDLLCIRLADLMVSESGQPVLVHLLYGLVQLLSQFGILPQVGRCAQTHQPIALPELTETQPILFSPALGGIVIPGGLERTASDARAAAQETDAVPTVSRRQPVPRSVRLTKTELNLLQQLVQLAEVTPLQQTLPSSLLELASTITPWLHLEQALRQYIQYHVERPIQSATLLDSCFFADPLAAAPLNS